MSFPDRENFFWQLSLQAQRTQISVLDAIMPPELLNSLDFGDELSGLCLLLVACGKFKRNPSMPRPVELAEEDRLPRA